jgi:glycosyltransferase involved in cell wall biosynthesis
MTDPTMRACAVIPVFDNATTVDAVARAAAQYVDHVIVVDDGSRDGTHVAALVASAVGAPPGRRIELITLGSNRGKGAALAVGLRRAAKLGCTHAVTLDADGQHRASDIPKLLAASAAHPRAIVVGARDMDGEHVPDPARVGRRVANFWTHRSTGFELPDTTCGFRVYPVAEVLELPIRTRRYDYEGEVLVRGAWAGLGLVSVPVDVWYPADRATRVSHYRPWVDSARITVMFVRLALRRLLPMGRTGRAIHGVVPPRVRLADKLRRTRELITSGTRSNELALAIGIGAFVGATPLWGLHAPLTLYIAARWRLNLVASFLATNVSFPAFAPALVFAEIQFGHLLRAHEWLGLRRDEFTMSSAWSHLADYLVGGFALAALLGVAAGLATLKVGSVLSRRAASERPLPASAGAGAGAT